MAKGDKRLDGQLSSLAALAEPLRRRLYLYVRRVGGETSRDQAARALRISRNLAAFHLDKLVEAGLLDASYRRLTARTGPGAGRPSKLYRPSSGTIDVSLPPRRYDVAARLLARAMEAGGTVEELERAAAEWGAAAGRAARESHPEPPDGAAAARLAMRALAEAGFEPRREESGDIVLGNCPFDSLRAEARTLVCGMNLALCRAMILEIGGAAWLARLAPSPERCCVVIRGGLDPARRRNDPTL